MGVQGHETEVGCKVPPQSPLGPGCLETRVGEAVAGTFPLTPGGGGGPGLDTRCLGLWGARPGDGWGSPQHRGDIPQTVFESL